MPLDDNRTRFFTRRDFTAPTSCVELYTADEVRKLFPTGAESFINGDIAGFEDRHDDNPATRGQWGRVDAIKQDATLEIYDEKGAYCGDVPLATMLARQADSMLRRGIPDKQARLVAISQLLADGHAVKVGAAIYRLART